MIFPVVLGDVMGPSEMFQNHWTSKKIKKIPNSLATSNVTGDDLAPAHDGFNAYSQCKNKSNKIKICEINQHNEIQV